MSTKFACPALVVLVLSLVASAAASVECQPVQTRVGASDKKGPCTYLEQQFNSCIEAPIWGTLNGTWYYYASEGAWHAEWFPGPEPPEPFPGYSIVVLGWAIGVFETARGDLWVQDYYVFDFLTETSDGGLPVAGITQIVGGTGAWDGAWGWIGYILADESEWRGYLRGEICTP